MGTFRIPRESVRVARRSRREMRNVPILKTRSPAMAIRRLGYLGVLGLIGAQVLISHPIAGQDRGAAPPLVITAFGDKAAPRYSAHRLSWGDPDLQGVWSSDD